MGNRLRAATFEHYGILSDTSERPDAIPKLDGSLL